MVWLELEEGSLLSSSHTLYKLYDLKFIIIVIIMNFQIGSYNTRVCVYNFLQVNACQQTELDSKKDRRNLGTVAQMRQISLALEGHMIVYLNCLLVGFNFFKKKMEALYFLLDFPLSQKEKV